VVKWAKVADEVLVVAGAFRASRSAVEEPRDTTGDGTEAEPAQPRPLADEVKEGSSQRIARITRIKAPFIRVIRVVRWPTIEFGRCSHRP